MPSHYLNVGIYCVNVAVLLIFVKFAEIYQAVRFAF